MKVFHMLKKIFLIFPFIFSLKVLANELTTTYAFCHEKKYTNWNWVKDENDNYLIVNGYWRKFDPIDKKLYGDNYPYLFEHSTYAFMISKMEYKRIKDYCRKNEIISPADSSTSNWYSFEIEG